MGFSPPSGTLQGRIKSRIFLLEGPRVKPESLSQAAPPENFGKLDALKRHFPAISEAEIHTHKMHILGKFCRKTLRSDKKAI
jgi:hypothetical protein